MECAPGSNAEVVMVAFLLGCTAPVPRVVTPSLKVIVPVGVPEPGTVTVPVSVTDTPKVDGLALLVTATVVLALFTVCTTTGELLPLKLPSPPYTTVMLCVEGVAPRLLINPELADPEPLSATLEAMTVAPSRKLTVPVGVTPLVEFAVPVNTIGWPKVDGLTEDTTT